MKKLILFLFCVGSVLAQSLSITAPAKVKAGTIAGFSVDLTPGTPVAGLQWTFNYPAGVPGVSWNTGAASTAAGKSVSCAPPSASQICLSIGFNTTNFGAGQIATASIPIPLAIRGPITFSLTNVIGSDASGNAVAVTGGTATVTVTSPFDINGDGKVDSMDLGIVISQILGVTPCTTADFNGDGVCNVQDALLLVVDAGSPTP